MTIIAMAADGSEIGRTMFNMYNQPTGYDWMVYPDPQFRIDRIRVVIQDIEDTSGTHKNS